VVIRVLDPAEVDFPFEQAAMFYDVESGRELFVDPDLVRQQYRRRFGEHRAALTTTCSRLGIDLYELTTNQPLEMALFDLVSARMRRGRQVSRRQAIARPAAGGSR
jgi:uncharacterized protein (DUF58 family)